MGCDIHMFCEELETINNVKKWVNADYWRLNPYYMEDGEEEKYEVVSLCGGRDYALFSALCGVRDYTGGSPKISEPRGIPKDCSKEVKEASEWWAGDGHSHSYAPLREVKKFVKENKPTKFSGFITEYAAINFDEKGILPSFWRQGSSDKSMVYREWEDSSHQPLKKLYEKMAERFYHWCKPDDIEDGILDNFRIVFWFDN